jgi:hypothetical protein
MLLRFATLLFVLAFPLQFFAQVARARAEQLDDDDVSDVFTIAEMTFVIRKSSVAETKYKETDLARLMSPAAAVKIGLPNKATAELIDRLLLVHHQPSLKVASVINSGDAGYFWKLKWLLFPSLGGFSGIPSEYHAIVRSDGTIVRPELYLCDEYVLDVFEPKKTLFSVLAIDDLLPKTKSKINENEITRAAEKTFNGAISKFKIDDEFRTLAPRRQTFSSTFKSKREDVDELEEWAVRFVLSEIENPENISYVGSIVVWVTSDLMTSELSLGSWKAKPKRRDIEIQ